MQAEHTRFATAVPAEPTYWPALQSVHAVQLAALVVSLSVPKAHGPQLRLVVVVPAAVTYWPPAHIACAVQVVAGSAS